MTPEQYIQLGGVLLATAVIVDLAKWGMKYLLQDRIEKKDKTDNEQTDLIKCLATEVRENAKNIALIFQSIHHIETNELEHLQADAEKNRDEHKEIMKELTTIITMLKK